MSLYGSIVRGEGLKYQETRCGNGGLDEEYKFNAIGSC